MCNSFFFSWKTTLSIPLLDHHHHWITIESTSIPDSKVHGANIGPIWGPQDPGGPHFGSLNFAIWDGFDIGHLEHSGTNTRWLKQKFSPNGIPSVPNNKREIMNMHRCTCCRLPLIPTLLTTICMTIYLSRVHKYIEPVTFIKHFDLKLPKQI